MQVAFSFDDGTVEDLKIADLLIEFGLEFKTTFYFPVMKSVVNESKGRVSLNDEQELELSKAFEIGSHSMTHPLLTRIPIDQAEWEIKESKKVLEAKFNRPIDKFCYPRGYANPDIQNMVKNAGYTSARSTLVGYIHKSENPFFEQTSVHAGCDRKEYGGKNWFEYSKYMLDQAKNTPNSVFHVWGHGYELAAYPNGLDLFKELLTEIVASAYDDR